MERELSIVRLPILVLLILPLVFGRSGAYAYTQTCVGGDKIYSERYSVKLNSAERDRFLEALSGFASRARFGLTRELTPSDDQIDISLQALDAPANAISIENRADRNVLIASISECGSQGFRPYWQAFLRFAKSFDESRKAEPATAKPLPAGWSDRGVFAFGPDIVFDFKRGIASYRNMNGGLDDCSNATYYCALGFGVRLVLPRHCEPFAVGKSWSLAGATTTVLASVHTSAVAGPHPFYEGTAFLLGDPAMKGTVFEYDPAVGIRALYFRPNADLADAALKGGMPAFAAERRNLITLDTFGQCAP